MYTDFLSRQKTMGDVDVLWHEGVYHLFHLVLPNHDFIAHAVSEDGLNWERVENAIFIGDPGGWDDHMLWTMHVTEDPHRPGSWRMFYTGLSLRDRGRIQRIGLARSTDLRRWEKVADRWNETGGTPSVALDVSGDDAVKRPFPLSASPPHYEHASGDGRRWVSFRDPFYFREEGRGYMVMAARVDSGPMIRRGCVGFAEEVEPDRFELRPPLHHPGLYDDIEVPNLVNLDGRYYLIGSVREDAKIRFWHSASLDGPWENFFDNVLLPAGNYAARISSDDRGPFIWNFFAADPLQRTASNLMPPPKRLHVRPGGSLHVSSFEGFDRLVQQRLEQDELLPLRPLRSNPDAGQDFDADTGTLSLRSRGGFEAFLFGEEVYCFRFRALIRLDGRGKCGLLFRYRPDSMEGYHLSLDLIKGIAQLRAWGEDPAGTEEQSYDFRSLQANYWETRADSEHEWEIELLALRTYMEFSIDDRVMITMADTTYSRGRLGLYVESACLEVRDFTLEHLEPPVQPSEALPRG